MLSSVLKQAKKNSLRSANAWFLVKKELYVPSWFELLGAVLIACMALQEPCQAREQNKTPLQNVGWLFHWPQPKPGDPQAWLAQRW